MAILCIHSYDRIPIFFWAWFLNLLSKEMGPFLTVVTIYNIGQLSIEFEISQNLTY